MSTNLVRAIVLVMDVSPPELFVKLCMSDRLDRLQALVVENPEITRSTVQAALVSGEIDIIQGWASAASDAELGNSLALIAFSRYFQVRPDRYDDLVQSAKIVLQAGADPNTIIEQEGFAVPVLYGPTGATGHLELARLLLESGANPNDGESVFHAAQHN